MSSFYVTIRKKYNMHSRCARADLIKLNLEEADASFKITLAPTPKEALTILEKEPFDGIVSDFIIPLARKVYSLHLLEEI